MGIVTYILTYLVGTVVPTSVGKILSDAPELAQFWFELLRKKLGSARSIFQKARFLKFTENEPISHFYS